MARLWGALLVLALAWSALAGCSPDHPSATRPGVRDTAALDAYFRRQLLPGEPGGAVLVTRNEQVVFAGAYGLADLRTREPITTQTLFNVGSITKALR